MPGHRVASLERGMLQSAVDGAGDSGDGTASGAHEVVMVGAAYTERVERAAVSVAHGYERFRGQHRRDGAVHGGEADARLGTHDAGVQVLDGERTMQGGSGLSDDAPRRAHPPVAEEVVHVCRCRSVGLGHSTPLVRTIITMSLYPGAVRFNRVYDASW